MRDEFATWYASTSFDRDEEHTSKRWDAIQALLGSATRQDLELLARLAFRLKVQMSGEDVGKLRVQLAGGVTSPGDEELKLLAAATLAVALQANDSESALVATIVLSTSCGGLRPLSQPMDLIGMSANILIEMSDTERRRPALEQPKLIAPTVDKADLAMLKAIEEGNQLQAFSALILGINRGLSALARRQREFESVVQEYVKIQDEELDILWWLEGGHSVEMGADFADVPPEHRPLGIALELAWLTTVLPGPPAIASLLTRAAVAEATPMSITDAVQGMPLEWLNDNIDSFPATEVSPAITPIIFAMRRRHEIDGKDDWIAAWCAACGLSSDIKIPPLQMAEAAYREFSLVLLG